MFREVTVEVVSPLTREWVAKFSAMKTYGGDRDREGVSGKKRIAWLAEKLASGEWFTPVWSTARLDGIEYRVDGGHSSMMLTCVNGRWPHNAKAMVRRFECDTAEDMAFLFSQFDPKKSLRTDADKIRAHKAVVEVLGSVSPTDIRYAINGIAFALSGCGEERSLDEDSRIRLLHEYPEFILWASRFVRDRSCRRVGIVAALFETRNKFPDKAAEFWSLVLDQNHPDVTNPTRELASWFRTTYGSKAAYNQWPQRAYYVKSIHAWNAWRDGVTTALKYYPNTPLPRPK